MVNANTESKSPKPGYHFTGNLPRALALLRERAQWVTWDYVWNNKTEKWTKPPCDARTGKVCGATKPVHWGSFEEASATARRRGMAGVGLRSLPATTSPAATSIAALIRRLESSLDLPRKLLDLVKLTPKFRRPAPAFVSFPWARSTEQ